VDVSIQDPRFPGLQVRVYRTGRKVFFLVYRFNRERKRLKLRPARQGHPLRVLVARGLRHLPGTSEATIVAVTGYGQESDRSRAQDAGFDRHLTKPVDPQGLLKLVMTAGRRGPGPAGDR
jgi:hypothetical protein